MNLFQWLKEAGADPQPPVVPEADANTPPVRRRYRFSGYVQGVGFRYEAMHLASQLGLVGFAQNLSNGTVLVEIEGTVGHIDAFLWSMQAVPRFDITGIEAEDLPVTGKEKAFKIRY